MVARQTGWSCFNIDEHSGDVQVSASSRSSSVATGTWVLFSGRARPCSNGCDSAKGVRGDRSDSRCNRCNAYLSVLLQELY